MKDSSEDIDNWWKIHRCYPPEPRRLWLLYIISLIVTLILFLLAALSAKLIHCSWNKEPRISCNALYCSEQYNSLRQLRIKAEGNLKAAEKRKKELERIRRNGEDEHFINPWSWFESEIEQLDKVIKKSKKPLIQPILKSFLLTLFLVLLSLMIYLFIERLVILHAKLIRNSFASDEIRENKVSDWTLPHVIFGFLIAFFMIIAEISTSVLEKDKTWFGWDSFCVTPSAFVIKCIAFISFGLVAAAPFTMLWYLSGKKNLPEPDPLAQDGKFGAGRYVEFLQAWTLWLILAPSTLGIIWIRYVIEMEPQFSPARLLHGAGVGVLITIIVFRLIKNAVILRLRCEDALQREKYKIILNFRCEEALQRKKYKEEDKLPTDPTIAFIGTAWWKLPATVATAFTAIWALLEGLGLTRHFLILIR